MRLRLAWLAFFVSVALAPAVHAAMPKVLIVSPSGTASSLVQELATVGFANVPVFDASVKAPALTDLQPYDVALVYSESTPYKDAKATGDALADFVDNGGGVVFFDMNSDTIDGLPAPNTAQLLGRYASTYGLLMAEDCTQTTNFCTYDVTIPGGKLGKIDDPTSPLMVSFSKFSCDPFGSCTHLDSKIVNGGMTVAEYDDGKPLAVHATINGHNVVELNMFPLSSKYGGDWDDTTDGKTLIVNAIDFVAVNLLVADKSSLDFGNVALGAMSGAQTVTYKNTSTMAVTINSLAITGANASDFHLTLPAAPPITLNQGGSLTATVVLQPTVVGAESATLEADATGGTQSVAIKTALTGVSVGPMLTVTPSPLAIGGTPLNTPTKATLTIANTGGGAADISSIAVTTDSASFTATPSVMPPLTLTAGGKITVDVTFQSATAGAHNGVLTVKSQLPDVNVPLTASTGPPAIATNAASVIFGDQHVAVASPTSLLTIKNTGFSDLVVSSINLSGMAATDFKIGGITLPATIGAGSSTTYSIVFTPGMLGMRQATVTMMSSDPAKPSISFTVVGSGVGFNETITPSSAPLDFGTVKGGSTTTKTVTIANNSSAPLGVTSLAITGAGAGSYMLVGAPTPPFAIPGGTSQTLNVAFHPVAGGMQNAVLAIGLDDPNNATAMVMLTGIAHAGMLSIMPMAVDFGGTTVGSISKSQTVTLANNGDATLTVSSLMFGGAQAMDFAPATNLPTTPLMLDPGKSVMFDLVYQPQKMGSSTGELDIVSDDPVTPMAKLALTGMATQPQISVNPMDTIDFGVVTLTQSSQPMTVTISNTGTADLAIDTITTSPTNGGFSVDDPGPFTVKVGQARDVKVTFSPTMAGMIQGELDISPKDASLSAVTIMLTGQGVSPMLSVSPAMLTWPIVPVGKGGQPMTVTLTNGSMNELDFDFNPMSNVSSDGSFTVDATGFNAKLAAGASTTLTVNFNPKMNGPVSGNIQIVLVGGTRPVANVGLSGEGLVVTSSGGGCSLAGRGETRDVPLAFVVLLGGALVVRRRRRHG